MIAWCCLCLISMVDLLNIATENTLNLWRRKHSFFIWCTPLSVFISKATESLALCGSLLMQVGTQISKAMVFIYLAGDEGGGTWLGPSTTLKGQMLAESSCNCCTLNVNSYIVGPSQDFLHKMQIYALCIRAGSLLCVPNPRRALLPRSSACCDFWCHIAFKVRHCRCKQVSIQ